MLTMDLTSGISQGIWAMGIWAVKFLITLLVRVLLLTLLCSCLVTVFKLTLHKVTKTAIQAPQMVANNSTNDVQIMYYDYQGFEGSMRAG